MTLIVASTTISLRSGGRPVIVIAGMNAFVHVERFSAPQSLETEEEPE